MILHTLHGTIRRRLLLNDAADPEAVEHLVAAPFRPRIVAGHAIVGVCLLRIGHLRPSGVPAPVGRTVEAAAHRIAVERDRGDETETGVWILRRDADGLLPVIVGGRAFPGVHGRASIVAADLGGRLDISVRTFDGQTVDVSTQSCTAWNSTMFPTPDDASRFFRHDVRGWSPAAKRGIETIDMCTTPWSAEPIDVAAHASLYDHLLPPGSAQVDHGLLVRDVAGTWRDETPSTDRALTLAW